MRTSPTGSPASGRRRERGLTLVELLVVLTMVALIAALSAPLVVRSLPAVELRNAAEEMRGSFRAARAQAMRDSRDSWVTLDLDARAYRSRSAGQATALPAALRMEMTIARSEWIEPGRGRIRFFPDGTSTGGEVRMIREGHVLDVKVDWFDGSVSVETPDEE